MAKNIKLIALVIIFGVSAYISATLYQGYLSQRAEEEVIDNVEKISDDTLVNFNVHSSNSADASSTLEIN